MILSGCVSTVGSGREGCCVNWPKGCWLESKVTVRFWIITIILAAMTIITLKNQIRKKLWGKRMVILGAAESGVGAAVLAQKKALMSLFPIWEKSSLITWTCWTVTELRGKTAAIRKNWS